MYLAVPLRREQALPQPLDLKGERAFGRGALVHHLAPQRAPALLRLGILGLLYPEIC